MAKYYFEDFVPGSVDEYGPRLITREAIIDFASQYDPQPMHLDEDAGRASMLGGLAASGWHTCAIVMRMLCDWFVLNSASMGSPGVEEIKWMRPVRPGDSLTLRRKTLDARLSKSRPEMGIVRFSYDVTNQTGDIVLRMTTPMMIGARAAAEAGAR